MRFPRSSGILLHITSLPGRDGIGELGRSAYQFADFLAASHQKIWQVLPLSPTGYGDSPYQCFSAFAGNHLLIDLEVLQRDGLLTQGDLANTPDFPHDRVEYGAVIEFKTAALRHATRRFLASAPHSERTAFEVFCRENAAWLDDYALFMACKTVHHNAVWTEWEPPLRMRDSAALKEWSARHLPELDFFKFCQFQFFRQ